MNAYQFNFHDLNAIMNDSCWYIQYAIECQKCIRLVRGTDDFLLEKLLQYLQMVRCPLVGVGLERHDSQMQRLHSVVMQSDLELQHPSFVFELNNSRFRRRHQRELFAKTIVKENAITHVQQTMKAYIIVGLNDFLQIAPHKHTAQKSLELRQSIECLVARWLLAHLTGIVSTSPTHKLEARVCQQSRCGRCPRSLRNSLLKQLLWIACHLL